MDIPKIDPETLWNDQKSDSMISPVYESDVNKNRSLKSTLKILSRKSKKLLRYGKYLN